MSQSKESTPVLTYRTDMVNGKPLAKLLISNSKFTVEEVKKWFADAEYREFPCEEHNGQIVLTINPDPAFALSAKNKIPDLDLVVALHILAIQNLRLTDDANRQLFKDYLDTEFEKFIHKSSYTNPLNPSPNAFYLNAFDGLSYHFELLNNLREEFNQLRNEFKKKCDHQVTQWFKEQASFLFPTPNENLKKTQWNVAGSKSQINDEDRVALVKSLNLSPIGGRGDFNPIKLDIKSQTEEVNIALKKMIDYATKLKKDLDDPAFKGDKTKLQVKVDETSKFLRVLYQQKDLRASDSIKAIKTAYNTFEQNDINRSHGFYKVHSFFSGISVKNRTFGKTYKDENNKTRLVKSTMGELVYDFMQAVEKLPKKDTSEKNVAENLSKRSSSVKR